MATVIDSLVIQLGLDPRNFTQSARDAMAELRKFEQQALQSGKSVESEGKKFDAFFSRMKATALGLTAALMGAHGIKEFITSVTTMDAAVGRTAKTLNMTTAELSAWRNVAKQTGGSADEMTGALQGISGELNKLALGMPTHILPVLNSLQISVHKANGQLKTAGELMFDLSKAIDGMDPAKARALLSSLGIPDSVINTLLIGRQKLRDLYDEQVRLGIITREDAEAAQQLQTAWEKTATAATSLGRALLNETSPGMEKVLGQMTKIMTAVRDAPKGLFWWLGMLTNPVGTTWTSMMLRRKTGAPAGAPAAAAAAGGLRVSPTAGEASPVTSDAMAALAGVGGIDRVTGLKDAYHALLGRGSHHNTGNAMDVTAVGGSAKSKEVADRISERLTQAGIAHRIRNEYLDPSPGSTGGHIHITIIPPGGGTTGARGAAAVRNSISNRGGDTTSTNIDNLNVIVPGGDAPAIARSIGPAIQNYGISPVPADTGQW